MKKWNFKKGEYEYYEAPWEWHVITYSGNMYEQINCAKCGKEIIYGLTCPSLQIHDNNNFSYAICKNCYDIECKEEYS